MNTMNETINWRPLKIAAAALLTLFVLKCLFFPFQGEQFDPPVQNNPVYVDSTSTDEPAEPRGTTSEELGKRAGETYEDLKKNGREFIDGFRSTTADK